MLEISDAHLGLKFPCITGRNALKLLHAAGLRVVLCLCLKKKDLYPDLLFIVLVNLCKGQELDQGICSRR